MNPLQINITKDNIEDILKKKKILMAAWCCENKESFIYRNWYLTFKEIFKDALLFDPRKYYFHYGRKILNKTFLELVKKEKPDYILFCITYDEFYLDTFEKIKEISPNTKIINIFSDDEWLFDNYSRFYGLFFDELITVKRDLSDYKKDGLRDVHFWYGINNKLYKPLNLKKKYDVTFIGTPIRDRPEFIKFLVKNNINVTLFSSGWDKYPELAPFYKGFISQNDLPKVISQSKINLSFLKTIYKCEGDKDTHVKLRIFEFAACKSFQLIEYSSHLMGFFKNKKIIFKTKQDLLNKVNYYLKNEKQRENLAKQSYESFLENHLLSRNLKDFFSKIINKPIKISNFKLSKKIITLTESDLDLNIEELKQKLKEIDYISFSDKKSENSKYKDFFQAYSLEKTKKDISCCDYYVSSKFIGNYLVFHSIGSFRSIKSENFHKLVNINQLAVTKSYFFKNLISLKKIFDKEQIIFINKENTVFVSIPLITLNNIQVVSYEDMKSSFKMRFLDKLYALHFQKRLLFNPYLFLLLLKSLSKIFIMRYILESISNRKNWKKKKLDYP